ncbi:MAG: ribonuclease HII [Candidatus Omnitrophota bacterium]|nr:ribonuclease HII [Candidatus Omnitrophota bacterium]
MKRRSNTLKLVTLLQHEKRLSSQGLKLIVGIDEAGRGPLAGPVVAGAVILKDFDFKEDIDDSKKLSPQKRERAYREIVEKAIVGVGIVDEKTIDRINVYRATIRAMQEAVNNLKAEPDYALVDGRMKVPTKCPIKCIVGGDSKSLSIAAASIVAKVTRDRIMVKYDRVYPQYGFARHKGYGTKFHMTALEEHGPSPIHRFSFQPVKSLAR